MKALKVIGLCLGVLVAAILIAGSLMPDKYEVKREITINQPVQTVYPMIADFNNWPQWSPWYELEPSASQSIAGTPGSVGHNMSWKGDVVGSGIMTFTEVVENTHISSDLDFKEPMEGHAVSSFTFTAMDPNTTKIEWKNAGDLKNPLERILGPMYDKWIGKDFEKGLSKLKNNAEKAASNQAM